MSYLQACHDNSNPTLLYFPNLNNGVALAAQLWPQEEIYLSKSELYISREARVGKIYNACKYNILVTLTEMQCHISYSPTADNNLGPRICNCLDELLNLSFLRFCIIFKLQGTKIMIKQLEYNKILYKAI